MKELRFLKAMFVMLLVMFASSAWGETKTGSWTLTSTSSDWTASGNETYFSQPYGYKKANGTLTNKSISDFSTAGITQIKVGFKCLQNGATSSKLTIYLVDKDGKTLGDGVVVTPVNASAASKTTYQYATFTTNLTGATGFMMKVTTFGKNILINGAEYEITYTNTPATPYTVTFNAGSNGTCSTSSLTEVSTGAGVILPSCTANDNYSFVGWSTSSTPTSADAGVAGETYNPSSNCTLYAYYTYQAPCHNAKFFVNGQQYGDTQSVEEGASITFPTTNPTVDDVVFMGWAESEITGTQETAPTFVTSANMGTSDVTYYAVFAIASEGEESWSRVTTLNNITEGTYVIINGGFYLPNTTTGSTTSPSAVTAPTRDNNSNMITGTVEDAMKWNFTSTGTKNQFYIKNGGNKWLYAINTNNGLRVSDTDDKWTFATNTNGYFSMQEANNSRYCAKYKDGDDWRSYTSATATNYANSGKIELYKETSSVTYSDYCTTVGSPTKYDVNIAENIQHGSVSANPTTASKGAKITLTANPERNYKLGAWSVKDQNDNTIDVENNQFTMPASDVTVSATFVEIPTYTINWIVNTVTKKTESLREGEQVNAPDVEELYGKVFTGWVTTETVSADVKPTYIDVANLIATANANYYAVFATNTGEGERWVKVEDRASMETGTYAMITNGGYAFDGTFTDGHGNITNDSFIFNDGVANSAPEGTCELIITAVNTNKYTISNKSGDRFLYISVATAGHLAFKAVAETNNYWDFSKNENQTPGNEQWRYHFGTTTNDVAQLRAYNSKFRSYATNISNGEVVMFAKKEGGITFSDYTTTPTPVITLESITVKTPPTKVEYTEGENFDPTGLVITATYDDESSVDITYAEHESEFSFNPSLETSLSTSNTFVTIRYSEKECTQSITVNEAVKYTVTFDAQGGYCETESLTEESHGSGVTLPTATINFVEWRFAGWATEPCAETTTAPVLFKAGTTYNPTEDITLYAVYMQGTESGEMVFNRVTNKDDLVDGKRVVVVSNEKNYALTLTAGDTEEVSNSNPITMSNVEKIWTITRSADDVFTFTDNKSTPRKMSSKGVPQPTTENIDVIGKEGASNGAYKYPNWTVTSSSVQDCWVITNTNTTSNGTAALTVGTVGTKTQWGVLNVNDTNGPRDASVFAMRIYVEGPATTATYNSNPVVYGDGIAIVGNFYKDWNEEPAPIWLTATSEPNKYIGTIDATDWIGRANNRYEFKLYSEVENKDGSVTPIWWGRNNNDDHGVNFTNTNIQHLDEGYNWDNSYLYWIHNEPYAEYKVEAVWTKAEDIENHWYWHVTIKGISETYLPGDWFGTWTSPDDARVQFDNDGVLMLDLGGNATHEFKIYDKNIGSKWFTNNGTITSDTETPWGFPNNEGGNCHLTTSVAGTYTFYLTWNGTTPSLSVVYPKTAVITLSDKCNDSAKHHEKTYYYGSYSNAYAFIVPEDLRVAVVGVDENSLLVVNEFKTGDVVPANTGLMVSSENYGDHEIVLTNKEVSALPGVNNLRPSGPNGITPETMASNDPNCIYYRLTMHQGTQIGYWWGAENGGAFGMSANKAYLVVPEGTQVKSGAWFSDDELNGIENISISSNTGEIYNLNGQRVITPVRGQIYIMNGHKFIAK